MNTALLIMAAGIGSRYCRRDPSAVKQLAAVGPNGETLMEYSIYDAVKAGFGEIIFVIRPEINNEFRKSIGSHIGPFCEKQRVSIRYCYQDLSDIPGSLPEGRTKPWGTGQAVLSAKEYLDKPFAVINADDYYGRAAFRRMHDWLASDHPDNSVAMAGYQLKNTLSEHGSVTRGICETMDGTVKAITETKGIARNQDGSITADGKLLDPESYASMNFWGFPAHDGKAPAYVKLLIDGFIDFFETDVPVDPLKAEYLLPVHIGKLLSDQRIKIQVLETKDQWFGVTYSDDKPIVMKNICEKIREGSYPEQLCA